MLSGTYTSIRPRAAWLVAAVLLIGWWNLSAAATAEGELAAAPAPLDPDKPDKVEGPDKIGDADESPDKTKPASARDSIPTDLLGVIRSGGYLMIPIGICSLILVAFVLERAISLRRGRVIPRPFVRRFIKQLQDGELDRDKALDLCEANGSPVAQVFAGAARKWGRPAVEVEQAIIDTGERVTNGLRRYLRVINGVATVTPLLGLLGTVVGMIRAFNEIATAEVAGKTGRLAGGISEALLTTAGGLSVAIPALIFYLFFVSRVDRLIIDIDAYGQEVVNVISAEELQEQS